MKGYELLVRAEVYVTKLFEDPKWDGFSFHSINHTIRVCKKADEFAKAVGVGEDDYLALLLASMFHDTGYAFNYSNHELESVKIFRRFISEQEFEDSDNVEKLILATRPSADGTRNELEKIMHDVDLIGIGMPDFFEIGIMLREEWATMEGRTYTDEEWSQLQLDYLLKTDFLTEYGKEKFGKQRLSNIEAAKALVGSN